MARRAAPAASVLLVVDDDRLLCATLEDALTSQELRVVTAGTGAEGVERARTLDPAVVLLDEKLPDASGARLCEVILEACDRAKVIFMTAFPSFDNAVAALRAGAWDYLSKPFELDELELSVRNALRVAELEGIAQLRSRRRAEELAESVLVGDSPPMREARAWADLAAGSDAPVLISGETGTGKTLLGRYIHYASPRREKELVALNCSTLPESLAESELFGHERGAFTGANASRRGVFEMADGGSVLLDEVTSMPVQLQPKLLTVVEEKVVRRLGGETGHRVDVRILAATNENVAEAIAGGSFRADLFYRLGVLHVVMPPLRDRRDDISPLARHLLRTITGREAELAPGEEDRLAAYSWPGNVRELRNLLERAAILQRGSVLRPSALLGPVAAAGASPPCPSTVVPLAEAERRHVLDALSSCQGNLTRTARALGISLSTLKRKLDGWGVGRALPRTTPGG